MRSEDGNVKRIYGVDFSGNEKEAGKKIWIAEGVVSNGQLSIKQCIRAADLQGSGKRRECSLPALRSLIADSGDSAWGLDFPFGLPLALIGSNTWEEFLLNFRDRFPSALDFKAQCRKETDDYVRKRVANEGAKALLRGRRGKLPKELKRVTDEEAKTPYSPYNLRMFNQTYYGISEILYPLVHDKKASVRPMQRRQIGVPTLYEICPASTLTARGLGGSYKQTAENRRARERILGQITQIYGLWIAPEIIRFVLDDAEGDALDSIIAAVAVCQAAQSESDVGTHPVRRGYLLEGYVYA